MYHRKAKVPGVAAEFEFKIVRVEPLKVAPIALKFDDHV